MSQVLVFHSTAPFSAASKDVFRTWSNIYSDDECFFVEML